MSQLLPERRSARMHERAHLRRVGRFEFRVTLPNQVDEEKIDAELSDGVLTVRIPKAERSQRRQIEVKGR